MDLKKLESENKRSLTERIKTQIKYNEKLPTYMKNQTMSFTKNINVLKTQFHMQELKSSLKNKFLRKT